MLALFTLVAIAFTWSAIFADILEDVDTKVKVAVVIALVVMMGASITSHAEVRQDEVLNLVNDYRVANGVEPLTYDTGLQEAADIRANESIAVWSHTRPDGSDWWTVDERIYGENLGHGYNTAEELVNAWIASPTHLANLVNPKFHTMALGVAGNNYAQEFGR